MITTQLNYPYPEDIKSYSLPLPETFKTKGVCVLLFNDITEYYDYLGRLCDLVDELEFNLPGAYTRQKADKLEFCKRYLIVLASARLAVY